MAIIDRDSVALTDDELARLAELERAEQDASRGTRFELSAAARIFLATLSAAAGAIHLVMVPSHASEWLAEGLAFAAAGWLQLGLAVLLVTRPSRAALWVSCAANAVFIAAWAVTRIWGAPFGPEAGAPHAASFIDITCVALEAVIVLVGIVVLAKPDLGSTIRGGGAVVLSVIPVGILVLTTAAIASPSAVNHAHAGGTEAAAGGHDHGHDATTTNGSPSSSMPGAAGDGHGDHGDHSHGGAAATPVDDKGLSQIMNGAGEGGGHVHTNEVVPVDAATQAQLDEQLAKMKPLMDKYPTVRDAEAAGYRRQGPYAPALGAHYSEAGRPKLNLGPTVDDEAIKHPMLIFDGVSPDSKLVGFMYLIYSLDTEHAPEGFVGPNDHWHYHTDVCITLDPDGGTNAPLGADQSATKELCDKYGGILIKNTGYMVHVWPVPGYESPQGLFSNLNAKLTCPNGTYYTVPQDDIGTKKNICKDVAV